VVLRVGPKWLSFLSNGNKRRLTDVHEHVIKDILAG
jgi:hypothetical protein